MKNVQITYDLFRKLVLYHLSGMNEYQDEIEKELDKKMEALVDHEWYSKYKTAPTETEREEARRKYLERRRIPEDFCR